MKERPAAVWRANRETAAAMFAAFLLLGCIYAYFCIRLYRGYILLRDDPGNIGGTVAEGLRGWFTRGMADYYHVYPEWPQPGFSNFYRPVWNLILYAEEAIFGQHYWLWFLFFCAVQYAGAFLFLRMLRSLGVTAQAAWFFAILFLFNPAFLNSGFIYPGFQFDIFVSLMLLAALYLLLQGRNVLALALITAAVFTKESAIFAAVAASVTIFILKRDIKWAAAMLAPLLAWTLARWLAYGTVLGGTFESPAGIHDILANIAKGVMVWPSGAFPAIFPPPMAGASGVALSALLLINAALWLILGMAAWRVARAMLREPRNNATQQQAILLTWTLGALAFCMLARPQTRFGASLYAFLLLFLACFLFANSRPKVWKLVTVAILSFVILIRAGNFLWSAVANVPANRDGERALYAALESLPQDGSPVFIVNAPTMLSAPRFLAKAWHLKRDVVFIDQFRGCPHAESGGAGYALSATLLSVEIPPCASYVLAGVPDVVQAKVLVGALVRPGIGTYQFPDTSDKRLKDGDIDFGRELRIRFAASLPPTVLAYDWQDGTYRRLAPSL